MKRQNGFTLIELVVVIVTLGILDVTAAPRFLDISSDARKSTLKGLKGAVNSAFTIVHSKSVLEGKSREPKTTLSSGIEIRYGYPTYTVQGLGKAVSGLSSDFSRKYVGPPDAGMVQYSLKGNTNWKLNKKEGCSIYIVNPLASYEHIPPEITLYDGGVLEVFIGKCARLRNEERLLIGSRSCV